MSKGPSMVTRGVRRAVYMVVVTIMAIGGLGLAAGGGYLLLADNSITDLPTSMREVLAEEVTPGPTPRLTAQAPTGAPPLTIVTATQAAATQTAGLTPMITPTATVASEELLQAAATTPTPTRIVRATGVPTQTPTPLPGSTELPDTGFGEFIQPLAGLGLAGIALVTHAIRRRR
ncbi:MAG: LPXTG cell wall anchor domain-containing protein [Anaerolineae bacterium]